MHYSRSTYARGRNKYYQDKERNRNNNRGQCYRGQNIQKGCRTQFLTHGLLRQRDHDQLKRQEWFKWLDRDISESELSRLELHWINSFGLTCGYENGKLDRCIERFGGQRFFELLLVQLFSPAIVINRFWKVT